MMNIMEGATVSFKKAERDISWADVHIPALPGLSLKVMLARVSWGPQTFLTLSAFGEAGKESMEATEPLVPTRTTHCGKTLEQIILDPVVAPRLLRKIIRGLAPYAKSVQH